MTAGFEVSGHSQDDEDSTRGVLSDAVAYMRTFLSGLQGISAEIRHKRY